jgi:signal transduction histidine kinase
VEEALRWLPEGEGQLPPDLPRATFEGTARIVVADDNADMRDYLRRILAARWEVEVVPDGRAALEAARRRRPDLVLTDVMMPVLDGFGLLRELRADPALANVPVVMLSARAGEESRVDGLEAGADDYLVKPFSARELLARVSTQLRLARAQSALERRWEEVREILRLMPVATAIISLPEERYEFVNEAYVSLMGRDPVGKTMDEAWSDLPPEALDRLRELRRRVQASADPVTLSEVPRALPGGTSRYYTASLRVWADPAGQRRMISTAVDVTDQVVARQQTEQSREQIARSERELRRAMTLRDDFLTMASHELRTPLTTLGLEAEGLRRSIEQAPRSDPALERWMHRAARLAGQAMRLEQLIEGMLDLAGLTGELSPGREEDLDLSDLARSVVERFREESQRARASITLLAEPVSGRWERRRVERILTQLVGNALKFGADNPIDVAVGPVGERARIAIKDRGIGIQLEDQERIFGRFERAVPPEHYGGFGVGLWLVGELVKSMSGSVHVDSRPGEGATFVIELPRRP